MKEQESKRVKEGVALLALSSGTHWIENSTIPISNWSTCDHSSDAKTAQKSC